eukprot:9503416-Pyramimonas_sp.AAC.1
MTMPCAAKSRTSGQGTQGQGLPGLEKPRPPRNPANTVRAKRSMLYLRLARQSSNRYHLPQ